MPVKERDTSPVMVRLLNTDRFFLRWLSAVKTAEAGQTVEIADLVAQAIHEKYGQELEVYRATVKTDG